MKNWLVRLINSSQFLKKNFILIKGMHMPFIATIDNIFIKNI